MTPLFAATQQATQAQSLSSDATDTTGTSAGGGGGGGGGEVVLRATVQDGGPAFTPTQGLATCV